MNLVFIDRRVPFIRRRLSAHSLVSTRFEVSWFLSRAVLYLFQTQTDLEVKFNRFCVRTLLPESDYLFGPWVFWFYLNTVIRLLGEKNVFFLICPMQLPNHNLGRGFRTRKRVKRQRWRKGAKNSERF